MWCIEKFGVDRCMFESNFPVDGKLFDYSGLWDTFMLLTKDFSDAERLSLFCKNTVRIQTLTGLSGMCE